MLVQSPLYRIAHALQPWVTFFIMPVFALANAGVHLPGEGGGEAAAADCGRQFPGVLYREAARGVFVCMAFGEDEACVSAGGRGVAEDFRGELAVRDWLTMSMFIATLSVGEANAGDRKDRDAAGLGGRRRGGFGGAVDEG